MFIRAFIVLLLVLNLGVAAWWYWSTPAATGPVVALPPNVARLQLVSERGADAQAMAPAAASQPDGMPNAMTGAPAAVAAGRVPAIPDDGEPACYSLGPFTGEAALMAAQATLKPLAESVAVRRVPPRTGRGWRVHLPALASADEAEAVAVRIASAGFRDYFIVREGAEANSVALGRFATESAARRHAAALNAAGFAARAEPMGGATGTAWLDVRVAAGVDMAAARVQAGAAEQRPLACGDLR